MCTVSKDILSKKDQKRHLSLIAQDDAQLFPAGIVTFHRVAR